MGNSKLHPFQKAGLGVAPFKCVGVSTNWYVTAGGAHRQPGGTCDYCGTGILYEYKIVSSDGKQFVVGSRCVEKTAAEVDGFKQTQKDFEARRREAVRKAKQAERQAEFEKKAAERRAGFEEANPGLYKELQAKGEANGFFRNMVASIDKWGSLTENQLAAVKRILSEQKEREAVEASSEFVGTVGQRVSGAFTILMVMTSRSRFYPFPTNYFYVMKDGNGNLFVYRGSVYLGDKGDGVTAEFKVKEHAVYKEAKQTVVSYPKDVQRFSKDAAA